MRLMGEAIGFAGPVYLINVSDVLNELGDRQWSKHVKSWESGRPTMVYIYASHKDILIF